MYSLTQSFIHSFNQRFTDGIIQLLGYATISSYFVAHHLFVRLVFMHPDMVIQGSERLVASLCSDVLMWDVGANIFKNTRKLVKSRPC